MKTKKKLVPLLVISLMLSLIAVSTVVVASVFAKGEPLQKIGPSNIRFDEKTGIN